MVVVAFGILGVAQAAAADLPAVLRGPIVGELVPAYRWSGVLRRRPSWILDREHEFQPERRRARRRHAAPDHDRAGFQHFKLAGARKTQSSRRKLRRLRRV